MNKIKFNILRCLFCKILILNFVQLIYANKPISLGENGTQRELFVDKYLINKISDELIQYVKTF